MQKALCRPGADLVICDEGHRIKNDQANISHALKKIQTRYESICVRGGGTCDFNLTQDCNSLFEEFMET